MTLRQIAAVSLIAFSLSACEAVKTTLTGWDQTINGAVPAAPAPRSAQMTAPAKPTPPPQVSRKSSQKKAAAKSTDSQTVEAGQPVPPPAAALIPSPQPMGPVRLIGLSTSETSSLLGRPESEREASPGKIWHYSSGACSLDVHFFFDVSRNEFYALDYKAKGDDAEACLIRLRKPAAKS